MWGLEVPLGYVLSHMTPLAQFGVPWAIVIAMTVRLVAYSVYYWRGRWLRTGLL